MTVVATTLPTFPTCPHYGFSSQPDYLVKKVQREGGFERRDRKWAHPLHVYLGAPMGPADEEDIQTLLEFWHAMGGSFQPFRFRDLVDYKSCRRSETPAPTDQPIASIPDSPVGYRLIKRYAVSTFTQLRPIYKIDGSTLRIANEVGVEQAAGTWTINEDTGVLTVSGGFSGLPTTWGGEFFVKCRFQEPFAPEIVDMKIQSLTCNLCELREE
jgi:uncharacterized protein (TIGR02217 family)